MTSVTQQMVLYGKTLIIRYLQKFKGVFQNNI